MTSEVVGENNFESSGELFRISLAIRNASRKIDFSPAFLNGITERDTFNVFSFCFSELLLERAKEIIDQNLGKIDFTKALDKAAEECFQANPTWLIYYNRPFSCRKQMERGKGIALGEIAFEECLEETGRKYLEASKLIKTVAEKVKNKTISSFEAFGLFIWSHNVRKDELETVKTFDISLELIRNFSLLFRLVRKADSIREKEGLKPELAIDKAYDQITKSSESSDTDKNEKTRALKDSAKNILNNEKGIRDALEEKMSLVLRGFLIILRERIRAKRERGIEVNVKDEVKRFGEELFIEGNEDSRYRFAVSRFFLPMAEFFLGEESKGES